jgi:hypothetical protein
LRFAQEGPSEGGAADCGLSLMTARSDSRPRAELGEWRSRALTQPLQTAPLLPGGFPPRGTRPLGSPGTAGGAGVCRGGRACPVWGCPMLSWRPALVCRSRVLSPLVGPWKAHCGTASPAAAGAHSNTPGASPRVRRHLQIARKPSSGSTPSRRRLRAELRMG